MHKNICLLSILIATTFGYFACGNVVEPELDEAADEETEIIVVDNGDSHDDSDDYTWDSTQEVQIVLNGNSVIINGDGATASGSTVTITSAGTYTLKGSLDDGQIIVNTADQEIARLILNGVNLNCSTNAPIYVAKAEKAMLVLADNTENKVTDGTSYALADADSDEPNAAIFSKSDLTIFGNGALTVTGNYNDGIASKDGLIISSGTIQVTSVDDGIRGKDYLIIKDGAITVDADDDGLKSDNDNNASMGYITIEDGAVKITAGGDAINAEKDVTVRAGEIDLYSDDQGITAAVSATFDGGTYKIYADGDAIHSDGLLTINNGSFEISSADDGLHADSDLIINDGIINIIQSYEGIESATGDITINDGEIHLVSSDDALNLAAGSVSNPGSATTGNYYLYINDGYIVVDAGGDGIDANASVVMAAGDLIVSGSSASNNSALDYDGTFEANGGFLVAAGSYSRMSKAPSTSSAQNCILVNLSAKKNAGTLIHIKNSSGQEILTYSPAKAYQSVAFSSPELETGTTFTIYLGGSSTGTSVDGIYKDGTYSGGTVYKSFTISSRVTTIN